MHFVTRTRRPLAEIALDLAYTDQAHMTREFIVLADRTPFALRRAMSAFDKK
jgi:AraC-like DNA-binding protein